ncbi:MAG: hypothetical protein ACR2PL_19580 [Dehalococcoidia bacterium]
MHHYHRYSLASKADGFSHWRRGQTLAQWDRTRCEALRGEVNPAKYWFWLKQGAVTTTSLQGPAPDRFGISITIHAPTGTVLNLAGKTKSLFDGALAAFHSHDGSALLPLSERVSPTLGVAGAEVAKQLQDPSRAILGRRRLLWLYREGVQWNPADDRCVAGELLLQTDRADHFWALSEELFEVESQRM